MGKVEGKKVLSGGAQLTNALKEYGYGESMKAGLNRLAKEQRTEGFKQGVAHALKNVTFWDFVRGKKLT